jgi:hypothetical protein
MPKPPDSKRIGFPFKGAIDRGAYIDTPGDAAPIGTIINVRPRDPILGRERGGKRPGLREVQDRAGAGWGQIGTGPIQAIHAIARPAEQTGFRLGTGAATHQGWESRFAGDLSSNLYVLRNKDSSLYLSRSVSVGDAAEFEDPTDRDLTAGVWYGANKIAGGVNENPFDTDFDNLVFKATFTNGAANDGFGSPGWTTMANWDTGASTYSTLGGPWPTEVVGVFYDDSTLANILFVASSVTAGTWGALGSEPFNKGFLVAYDLTGTAVMTAGGDNGARIRPFGKVYNEATPGDPSTLTEGSLLNNPGAIEIRAIACKEVDGVKAVYFCYDAARRGEAMVGRLDVTNMAATGFDLSLPQSGAFQTNGAGFGLGASNFTIPTSPLDPHFLSVNYPRGGKPTGVDIDENGYVYFTCSSAGEGIFANPAAGNYRPDHHPDFPGHRPVTVCKVDPTGSYFIWESVTNHNPAEGGYARINDPELIWCKADSDGCYVGGRMVGDANVFAVNGFDGGIRWRWRSATAGTTSRIFAATLDPTDGNLWVVGQRTNTWRGVTDSKYAQVWKLSSVSGDVLQSHDLGPGIDAISIDINPDNGLMLVGTSHPGT